MGKIFSELDERLREFIAAQHLFFIATAPLSGDGHVNLSPKGLDCLRVLDAHTVAYLDLTGSGIETTIKLRNDLCIDILPAQMSQGLDHQPADFSGSGHITGGGVLQDDLALANLHRAWRPSVR